MVGGRERPRDDAHPFGLHWMDSCYQETLLPNGPWQAVYDTLTNELAERIKKQLDIPERRQMLFELLGQQFVQKYFPNEEYLPAIIAPPQMASEARKKLQLDAQNWLQSTINKIATDTGSQRSLLAEQAGVPQSKEMQDYLKHTALLFAKGMSRELLLQEKEIERQWEEAAWRAGQAEERREEAKERARLQQEYERLHGLHSTVRSVLRTMLPPSTAGSAATNVTANVKGAAHGLSTDPPSLWGVQSEQLGVAILAVLQRDPRRFTEVAARLHGRQLPAALRRYVWRDVLLRHERHKLDVPNIETIVRERFGKALERGMRELRIQRATHSPITGLIDKAVSEKYETAPGMKVFGDQAYVRECARALNVLYVYDRSYEPYLIYWLFPLQLAFQDAAAQSEHVYELAMYLDLLNKSCFPKWPQIFAIAEKTMVRLKVADRELHDHLKKIAQIEPTVNPKEFMVQLIHEEKSQAEAILKTGHGSKLSLSETESESLSLLADPIVFIRRWVGEGFVGVLDTQAAVFVWDQLFLQKWLPQPMEDVCLALLLLLKYQFMRAHNYHQMREVFLEKPCHLFTKDLQEAWRHIQNQQSLELVPLMNRQRPSTPPPPPPPPDATDPQTPGRAPSVTPSERSVHLLSVGIKDIRLKLVLPEGVLKQEKWLSALEVARLYLVCTVYYGEVEMETQKSYSEATQKHDTTDQQRNRLATFAFPKQKFVFLDMDLSRYDIEREMGGVPYAVIRAEYRKPDGKKADIPVTLGSTERIKLYQDSNDATNRWQLCIGRDAYPITSGQPGETDTTPRPSQELLGEGSELGALLFDPHDEPQSALATPLPPRTPTPAASATPAPSPWKPGIRDTFDIYVDGVDNVPDSATIVKVTGRLVRTGELAAMEDVLAFPDLSSPARCPRFQYRVVVNEGGGGEADPRMLLLLRLYTVDIDTQDLVVIGSMLVELFDPRKETLKVGGYRRLLRVGMPELRHGIEALSQAAMDDHARIPACWVYFRLAPHTDDPVYQSGELRSADYRLLDTPLSVSEKQVAESYASDAMFPKTQAAMADRLMKRENKKDGNVDGWRRQRLDNLRNLPPNVPAANLDLHRLVQYRIARGLNVKVRSAYGLPKGLYVQALCRVIPGKDAKSLPITTEGWGGAEKFVTATHNLDSLQTAPEWSDKEKELHPHADPHSIVAIQLFALDAIYTPSKKHDKPGTVRDRKTGKALTLGAQQCLAWTLLPLFDKSYVLSGTHHLPLFEGEMPTSVLKAVESQLVENVFHDTPDIQRNRMAGAALVVDLWDNHFVKPEHVPAAIEKFTFLLEAIGAKEDYEESEKQQQQQSGPKMSQFVVDALPAKERKQGTESDLYIPESMYYQTAIGDTFQSMMRKYCVAVGYGELESNTPRPS